MRGFEILSIESRLSIQAVFPWLSGRQFQKMIQIRRFESHIRLCSIEFAALQMPFFQDLALRSSNCGSRLKDGVDVQSNVRPKQLIEF